MGMPQPMSGAMWYQYKETLNTKATEAADEHLKEAVQEVRRTYIDKGLGKPDDEGILNIVISVDGSWQQRGHKSHNGVVTVIEHHTGLIVDSVALSNYCYQCQTGQKVTDAGYREWQRRHQPQCQKKTLTVNLGQWR
ncbi:hypothetical protein ACOMHN_066918 [Nucella lapillus]